MIPRPALVPVRLRDLRLSEEFETSCSRRKGRVMAWGYSLEVEERTGRKTRVRACLCRFGTVEQIYSAEMRVLVPFDRPHARQRKDDAARWAAQLREPFVPAKVRAEESRRYGGLRIALDEPKGEHPELRATLASLAHLRTRSA